MNIKIYSIATIILIIFLFFPSYATCIIHGFGHMDCGGWDFSDSICVDIYQGDFTVWYISDPPEDIGYWISANNGAKITMVQDSTFEELTTAPQDSSVYELYIRAYLETTFVLITEEGNYVKFKIYTFHPSARFEYYYQPDGSPLLVDPVGTEQMTWGQIKTIFK